MKKKELVIAFLSIYSLHVFAGCPKPTAGTPVWKLAATAIDTINTTESKVCEILFEVNNDFAGTFTVADNVLAKACNNLTLVQQIDSSFDQLIVNLPDTISKLCVIDSKVDVLTSQVEDLQVDISGTFTALDGLKTTVCSKLEQISDELGQIETNITLLTQTEIDHALTIASQLSVLQTDVDLLNSALDALTITVSVQELDSCVDILASLIDDLDMDVDNLQGTISNGFAGTFTALDTQLSKACIIESLTDVAQPTAIVDFSGVFTALDALQEKVCNIESLVDIICLINSRDIICSTDSKIDIALSKICLAEQEIVPLPSLADVIISKLESVEMAGFDVACSKIEAAITIIGTIGSKVDTIESKVCEIDIVNNTSKLEVIDRDLITIESKLDTIDAMTSKLCVIDSELDTLQQQALTIESIIDVIDTEAQIVDSKIDALNLISTADLLESKLCEIEPTTQLIVSNLDLLLASLQTSDSKLDIMIPVAESNIEQLLTIESRIEVIDSKLDTLNTPTLISKLCLIEDQVCTIESVLDIIGPLIGILNVEAQELIGDFQETWTILEVIENKLCTAEPILETITSKLDQDFNLDLSGVFTEIEAILQKECTIDSKVDIALSLVDIFVSKQDAIDFSRVFTALDALLMKVCTVDSQTDVLESKVSNLVSFCGIPIHQSDVGTTGLTISAAARYFLAEDITFNPSVTGNSAINITVSNVTLDLSDRTLEQGNATATTRGILINNGLTNIRVENGTVRGFQDPCILLPSGAMTSTNMVFNNLSLNDSANTAFDIRDAANIVLKNITGTSNSDGIFVQDSVNVTATRCVTDLNTGTGFAFLTSCSRCISSDSTSKGNGSFGLFGGTNNILDSFIRCRAEQNDAAGIRIGGEDGLILNCNSFNNGTRGLSINAFTPPVRHIIIGNSAIGNAEGVRLVGGANNNYFAFNTFIENASNIDEQAGSGPNTYLGNFAFNSTAVGDPNNTNYALSGSDITRKFVTASQDGSFGDFPTKWHNINMLP